MPFQKTRICEVATASVFCFYVNRSLRRINRWIHLSWASKHIVSFHYLMTDAFEMIGITFGMQSCEVGRSRRYESEVTLFSRTDYLWQVLDMFMADKNAAEYSWAKWSIQKYKACTLHETTWYNHSPTLNTAPCWKVHDTCLTSTFSLILRQLCTGSAQTLHQTKLCSGDALYKVLASTLRYKFKY